MEFLTSLTTSILANAIYDYIKAGYTNANTISKKTLSSYTNNEEKIKILEKTIVNNNIINMNLDKNDILNILEEDKSLNILITELNGDINITSHYGNININTQKKEIKHKYIKSYRVSNFFIDFIFILTIPITLALSFYFFQSINLYFIIPILLIIYFFWGYTTMVKFNLYLKIYTDSFQYINKIIPYKDISKWRVNGNNIYLELYNTDKDDSMVITFYNSKAPNFLNHKITNFHSNNNTLL